MSKLNTINMIAAALGGEGGGVFTNWVIDVAEREGWLCQTTSLAGVAQRTGATIYYLEFFPREQLAEQAPVMSLFPAQGDIDIAVASEVAEAARMVQRGFVSAERTTLIASDHRVYSIAEKSQLGDGTTDPLVLQEIAGRYAKDYIHYDMLALANKHNSVISSVMLGALAGSEVMPFAKATFEAVITDTGKAVATNLAAFEASYQRASSRGVEQFEPVPKPEDVLPKASTPAGEKLLQRLQEFPQPCRKNLYHGVEKCVDYQDYAYAHQYLDEVQAVVTLDAGDQAYRLAQETARYLALWMCFEDIPRVAQFKTRAVRMEKVREEVKAEEEQFFDVTEFFRPRVEEMSAMMPPVIGNWMLNSAMARRFLNLFTGGKQLRTNTVTIFLMLRFMASLKRFRRGMLGFQHEHAMIARWLQAVRTTSQMLEILSRVEGQGSVTAECVEAWRTTALADDAGDAFRQSMAA